MIKPWLQRAGSWEIRSLSFGAQTVFSSQSSLGFIYIVFIECTIYIYIYYNILYIYIHETKLWCGYYIYITIISPYIYMYIYIYIHSFIYTYSTISPSYPHDDHHNSWILTAKTPEFEGAPFQWPGTRDRYVVLQEGMKHFFSRNEMCGFFPFFHPFNYVNNFKFEASLHTNSQ